MELNRIPHIYHNTKYSIELFKIIFGKHQRIRKMWEEIEKFYNIDLSHGVLLDMLGENFKVSRHGRTDQEYKRLLKFEIPTFNFFGSPEEIKRILGEFYNIPPENFNIFEYSGKIMIRIPDYLDGEEVKRNIKRLKAAGVGLLIDIDIYIEDFTLLELSNKTLEEIEKITLARR